MGNDIKQFYHFLCRKCESLGGQIWQNEGLVHKLERGTYRLTTEGTYAKGN